MGSHSISDLLADKSKLIINSKTKYLKYV